MKYRARITEALYSGCLSDIYVNEKQTVLRGKEATPSPAGSIDCVTTLSITASQKNFALLYKRKLHEEVNGECFVECVEETSGSLHSVTTMALLHGCVCRCILMMEENWMDSNFLIFYHKCDIYTFL